MIQRCISISALCHLSSAAPCPTPMLPMLQCRCSGSQSRVQWGQLHVASLCWRPIGSNRHHQNLNQWHRHHVGKITINHPPVITFFLGSTLPKLRGLWHSFTHRTTDGTIEGWLDVNRNDLFMDPLSAKLIADLLLDKNALYIMDWLGEFCSNRFKLYFTSFI